MPHGQADDSIKTGGRWGACGEGKATSELEGTELATWRKKFCAKAITQEHA